MPVRLERPYVRLVELALITDGLLSLLKQNREAIPGEVEGGTLRNELRNLRFGDVEAGVH